MNIFDKWNKEIDVEGLQKDVEEADRNGGQVEYKEVPVGDYEVKINKMELKESKNGDPMVSIWFKIIAGEFENNMLFMNQVITQGFQISIMNRFLKSLEAVDDDAVEFKNYSQYNDLILDIFEAVENLEFNLSYTKNKKGYNQFKVNEVYDA